jgi:hypothetical protein
MKGRSLNLADIDKFRGLFMGSSSTMISTTVITYSSRQWKLVTCRIRVIVSVYVWDVMSKAVASAVRRTELQGFVDPTDLWVMQF